MSDGGVQLSTTIDDAISKRLAALAARLSNLEPVLDEIGASNVTETQHRFEQEADPDGKPWQPLAALTLAKRKAARPRILRDKAHLFDSITHVVSGGKSVAVGSNRKYARIQQLGGMAGRGRKVQIPARPYLGISEEGRKEILQIVREHIEAR